MTTVPWDAPRLEPLGRRALWAQIGLAAIAVSDVAFLALELRGLSRLDDDATDAEIDAVYADLDDLFAVQTVLFLAVTILFIVWFHRAYSNSAALGVPSLRFGTGWAIGAWFVPVLNLWRPKQIANDIWRAADPGAPADHGEGWHERPVPGLLLAWWLLWIVPWFAGAVATVAFPEARARLAIGAALTVAEIAAAVLAIAVVRATSARQDARALRLAREEAAG